VLLFGVGGFTLILIPAMLSTYAGRYSLPMAAPMTAGAAITVYELFRGLATRGRRRGPA
jgi:hypothetical protein